MRKPTLVIAAVLACAASPVLAQSGAEQPAVIAPPPVTDVNPPEAEAAPGAVKAPAVIDSDATWPHRFSFSRVDDGFLRLDNQTGQVAYCSPRAIGWACQAVPEDRAALEKKIARLREEVANLKAQIALLREPPPRPPADLTPPPSPQAVPVPEKPPPTADKDKDRDTAKLRQDLERARLAFANAWQRLVDMVVSLQKDMMRKG